MVEINFKFLILVFIFVSGIYLIGCQTISQENSEGKVKVIVSILPQKTFVEKVGGDLVTVKSLIPPGGSPATYEPKPSDLIEIERAEIYFRIEHIPFEKSHIDKFKSLNSDLLIIDTSSSANLRYFGEEEEHSHEEEEEEHNDEEEENHEEEHSEEEIDPHIWLSPVEVKKQIDIIVKTLTEYDSANTQTYKKNAEIFKTELDDLDEELKIIFGQLKTNKLMVFHPSWGYLAREYGLEQIAIEQSGKEPTTEQLINLINEAKEENIKVIFVQSQFNKNIANSIAKEIDAIVVSIDPLSSDYINNLRNIARTIEDNLNKEMI